MADYGSQLASGGVTRPFSYAYLLSKSHGIFPLIM